MSYQSRSHRTTAGVAVASLLAVVAALLLSACGSTSSGYESKALQLWSRFPVNRTPRLLVISPEAGQDLDPPGGFPTDDAKLAFLSGRFELATALPHSPEASDGYSIITATQALKSLRNSGKPSSVPIEPPPLRITSVSLGLARFLTDRGYESLPAWRIQMAGVSTPAAVLAVGAKAIFAQPRLLTPPHNSFDDYIDEAATVSKGGGTVTISFIGGHKGDKPCDDSYTATIAQSSQAVVVGIEQHPAPAPPSTICDAVGYRRSVDVRLTRRLGARVLVDAGTGGVLPLYPTGTRPPP